MTTSISYHTPRFNPSKSLSSLPELVQHLPHSCPTLEWSPHVVRMFLKYVSGYITPVASLHAYNKIHILGHPSNLSTHVFFCSFPDLSIPAALAFLLVLKHTKFILASGPLHLMFLPSGCSSPRSCMAGLFTSLKSLLKCRPLSEVFPAHPAQKQDPHPTPDHPFPGAALFSFLAPA